MDAPSGKHNACIVSRVANLPATHNWVEMGNKKLTKSNRFQVNNQIHTLFNRNWFAGYEII